MDEINERNRVFDERFEDTFGLGNKNYSEDEVKFAQAALSNMLGMPARINCTLIHKEVFPKNCNYQFIIHLASAL